MTVFNEREETIFKRAAPHAACQYSRYQHGAKRAGLQGA
jgi:hypothetical protein